MTLKEAISKAVLCVARITTTVRVASVEAELERKWMSDDVITLIFVLCDIIIDHVIQIYIRQKHEANQWKVTVLVYQAITVRSYGATQL